MSVRKIVATVAAFTLFSVAIALAMALKTEYYMNKALISERNNYSAANENIRRHLVVSSGQDTLQNMKKKYPDCCHQRLVFADLNGYLTYLPMVQVTFRSEFNDAAYLLDIFGDLRDYSGYSRSEGEMRSKSSK